MSGKSILLVDDEEPVLELGKRALEAGGYEVTAFNCGLKALQHFQQDPSRFNLLLTDYEMPKINGGELAVNIKKIRNSLPVILVTGCPHITENHLQLWGINALLLKPYRIVELNMLVCDVLTCARPG